MLNKGEVCRSLLNPGRGAYLPNKGEVDRAIASEYNYAKVLFIQLKLAIKDFNKAID